MLIYDSDTKYRKLTTISNFLLIVEQILTFASSPSMVWEVKILSTNFKQITYRYFTLLNILIWVVRSILSLNSKQFHQKLYSDSLYIPYSEKIWRGFNLAQGKNEIFGTDLICRSEKNVKFSTDLILHD